MAKHQFLHFERYGRTVSKQATRHRAKMAKLGKTPSAKGPWTISDVLSEADRDEGAIPHVDDPIKPELLYGQPIKDLERELFQRLDTTKIQSSRKGKPYEKAVRKDGQVLLTIVTSYPTPIAAMTDDDWSTAAKWEQATVDYFETRLGGHLKTAAEHRDEGHLHLHLYAYDKAFSTELHPGFAVSRKGLGAAYKMAMKKEQDDYWSAVGQQFGFTRSGPRRPRLDRKAAKIVSALTQEVESLGTESTSLRDQLNRVDADRRLATTALAASTIDLKDAKATLNTTSSELAIITEDRDNLIAAGDGFAAAMKAKADSANAKAAAEAQAREQAEQLAAAAQDRLAEVERELNRERIMRQSAEEGRGSASKDTGRMEQAASRHMAIADGLKAENDKLLAEIQKLHQLREADRAALEKSKAEVMELKAIIERLTGTGGSGGAGGGKAPAAMTPPTPATPPSAPSFSEWKPKAQRIEVPADAVSANNPQAAPAKPPVDCTRTKIDEQVR